MKQSLRVLSVSVPCLLIVPMSTAAQAAPVRTKPNRAPRITAAKMVDSDRDDKVDHVVLTWSKPVTHVRDVDRHYPFAVPGYVVTSVGAARRHGGLTPWSANEQASKTGASAHPAVRYLPTTQGPVKDVKAKQAIRQSFARTVALDVDKDGYAATDCQPMLAWAHPGAVDKPDTGLVDANCDGIDGTRTGPIFVSPLGQDSGPGTITEPLATFDQAVTNSGGTRDIYLAAGTYPSALTTPLTSSVYGGYSPTWTRSTANASTLTLTNPLPLGGSPTLQLLRLDAPTSNTAHGPVAVTVENASARLESVTVTTGAAPAATLGAPAKNSVGLWAKNSTVQVVGGTISAGAGGPGASGTAGAAGDPGNGGGNGTNGECTVGVVPGTGGLGGTSPVLGHGGGLGGLGGTTVVPAGAGLPSIDSTPGGPGGATAEIGAVGTPGAPGTNGATGSPGSVFDGVFDAAGFLPGTATDGASGSTGKGGGGGGGGGAQNALPLIAAGNGGGGGGGGGAPGAGGTAASGGGGSMAVWADGSTMTLRTKVVTAGGGDGGPVARRFGRQRR